VTHQGVRRFRIREWGLFLSSLPSGGGQGVRGVNRREPEQTGCAGNSEAEDRATEAVGTGEDKESLRLQLTPLEQFQR
jgi:hypothetical protein